MHADTSTLLLLLAEFLLLFSTTGMGLVHASDGLTIAGPPEAAKPADATVVAFTEDEFEEEDATE